MMEILFVSHKYPPFTGGMEKQSFELVNGMKQYARVHTILYEGKGSQAKFFLTIKKRILETCRLNPAITMLHFNDGLLGAYCRKLKLPAHIKTAVTLHGLDIVYPNKIFQRFILPAFNRFDVLIAVSQATANAAIQRGILKSKVKVIPNGVDINLADVNMPTQVEFYKAFETAHALSLENRKFFVTMGRPVKRKGFSWFIKNVLPRLHENALLIMVGPYNRETTKAEKQLQMLPAFLRRQIELFSGFPTDAIVIRKLLDTQEWRNRILHVGRLPFEEIIHLLHYSDGFIMPNIAVEGDMEGFGLVCLEACVCGAKVFAANIDGIPDAIHDGKNGHLIPSGDVQKWVEALNSQIHEPENDSLLIADAVQYTREHFGWDKMVLKYLETFREATERV